MLGGWSGIDIALPDGGFYLWFDAGDGWEFAERLARVGGAVVSPGEFYGPGVRRSCVSRWSNPTTASS